MRLSMDSGNEPHGQRCEQLRRGRRQHRSVGKRRRDSRCCRAGAGRSPSACQDLPADVSEQRPTGGGTGTGATAP